MNEIKEILENPKESLTIEFKREWYWDTAAESKNKVNWDEFLKDFAGLCNTLGDNKYLIIGINDAGSDLFNYFEDSRKIKLNFFNNDLDEIKNEIIKKILNSFECFYFNNKSLDNEKDILLKNIILNIIDFNEKQILVIKINKLPFLLRLCKDRNIKNFREKNIIIRTMNTNGPSCTVLDGEEKDKYKIHFDSIYSKFKMLTYKNTIKHLIEAYAKFSYKRYNIKVEHKNEISYSNSDFFEIFSINQKDKYLDVFIYFSKYSSIQKVLEQIILKEYLSILNQYPHIYIVFEEPRSFQRIASKISADIISVENNKIFIGKKEIQYFDSSTIFIEKKIYEDIKNDIQSEVFFPKKFSGVFVNPLINDSDIDIIYEMKTWIDTKHSPIFALTGEGGVGKTTIAKKFCSQIENDVIFIDSKELISNLNYTEKLNTLYDFVKLHIISQENVEINENNFSEQLINILVDSGKLLIVIDGLDEVILNYSDFNLNCFIEAIYNNCLDNLGKTKILFTIRDTFWDSEYNNKIERFVINGFNLIKSKEYFEQKLSDQKLSTKAQDLLKTNLPNQKIFSPFILEVIVLAIQDNISKGNIHSNYICKDIFIDMLIYHICAREVIKFTTLYDKEIDKQIDFFIKIALEYNGEITLNQLKDIIDNNLIDAYKTHTLLSFSSDKKLSFKFDILTEYFKMLSGVRIINDNIYEYNKTLLIDKNNQLFKQIYLDNKNLIRINNNIEEIKFFYLQILEEIINLDQLENNSYIYSFILSLILRLNNKKDKNTNTELLKELLDKNDICVGLCLHNNHYLDDKLLFNFNDMKFKYSYVDYYYFGDSDFNINTKFMHSYIQGDVKYKCNFSESNFDPTSILSENMKKILKRKEKNNTSKNKNINEKIIYIFKRFYRNAFQEIVSERLKSVDNNILEFLIREGVIIKIYKTTSQKRKDEIFSINSKYQNDIELILNNQVENLKSIDLLIEKYNEY